MGELFTLAAMVVMYEIVVPLLIGAVLVAFILFSDDD